jgi:hypothetical protein
MRNFRRVPARVPPGTKYILEGRGPFVRRYVEFPNGRRVQLATRKALSCKCAAWQRIGIVPDQNAAGIEPPLRPARPRAAVGHRASAVARWMSVSGP